MLVRRFAFSGLKGTVYISGELGELQEANVWLPPESKLVHIGTFREGYLSNWDQLEYSNTPDDRTIQMWFSPNVQTFPNGF